jgi:TRAP-type C4-dicarboxylate transport system permease small subunit
MSPRSTAGQRLSGQPSSGQHFSAQRLDAILEHGLALLMVVMVLNVLWQVASRFLLGSPSSWTEELARYLLVWIGLFGGCLALRRNLHTAIEVVTTRLSPTAQRLCRILVRCSIALFAGVVLVLGGLHLVSLTSTLEQRSPALGLPLGFVYAALPAAGLLILWILLLDYRQRSKTS